MNENTIDLLRVLDQTHILYGYNLQSYEIRRCEPSKWSIETIDKLVAAAASNGKIRTLELNLDDIDHLTMAPFLELLKSSTSIECFTLEGSRNDKHPKELDILFDLIYRSMGMNKHITNLDLNYSLAGRPDLFQRCMNMMKIEDLSLSSIECSEEMAMSLAASFRVMGSLERLSISNLTADTIKTSLMILSLQNHPRLQYLSWGGDLEPLILSGLFSLCVSCKNINHAFFDNSGLPVNITPLLHGLQLSPSLEELHLSRFAFVDAGHFIFPANTTLSKISFRECVFEDELLTVLQYKKLKSLSLHRCDGFTPYITQACKQLSDLEELSVIIGDGDESQFAATMPQLITTSPKSLLLEFATHASTNEIEFVAHTNEILTAMSLGLDKRLAPLVSLKLTSYAPCESRSMQILAEKVMPKAKDLENIDISNLCPEQEHAESWKDLHSFLESAFSLKRLKTLFLYKEYFTAEKRLYVKRKETGDMIIKKLKSNDVFEEVRIEFDDDLEKYQYGQKLFFYERLNGFHRNLLSDPSVSLGLWPHILEPMCDEDNDATDAAYYFLKRLNSTCNIFKNAR